MFDDEPFAPPRPTPAAPVGVRDITELISAADLAPRGDSSIDSLRPLFEHEEPDDTKKKPQPKEKTKRPALPTKLIAAVAAAVIVLGGGGVFAARYFRGAPPSPAMGTLDVQSNPPGVEVFIDGAERGQTPREDLAASRARTSSSCAAAACRA